MQYLAKFGVGLVCIGVCVFVYVDVGSYDRIERWRSSTQHAASVMQYLVKYGVGLVCVCIYVCVSVRVSVHSYNQIKSWRSSVLRQ